MTGSSIPTVEYKDFSMAVHGRAAPVSKPIKAQIELTYGCNLHCVHCYTDCYNQRDLIAQRELPYEQVIGILDQLHDAGVLWVCFTGGEIFMREDFLDIYAYAREKGFLITLFTNVTLVSRRIADYLAQYPPFQISTSLHGATTETFERITQVKGSFERFLEGIGLLLERNLPVEVKTNAMTLNKHELGRIKELVEGLGLKFQLNTAIYPGLDGNLKPCEFRLTPDEIVELEFSEQDLDDDDTCQAHEEPAIVDVPPDDRLFRCGCGTTQVHIDAWGQLGTCTWVGEPRADLADNTVAEGIAEVFPLVRAAKYRTDTPCRSCRVYPLCDKMPANAAAENGDREQPVAHFCETAYKRAARLAEQAL